MAKMTMRKVQEIKLSEIFTLCPASAAVRGIKDQLLRTYEQHFRAVSKRMDVDSNIPQITSEDPDEMILRMREEGLPIADKHDKIKKKASRKEGDPYAGYNLLVDIEG